MTQNSGHGPPAVPRTARSSPHRPDRAWSACEPDHTPGDLTRRLGQILRVVGGGHRRRARPNRRHPQHGDHSQQPAGTCLFFEGGAKRRTDTRGALRPRGRGRAGRRTSGALDDERGLDEAADDFDSDGEATGGDREAVGAGVEDAGLAARAWWATITPASQRRRTGASDGVLRQAERRGERANRHPRLAVGRSVAGFPRAPPTTSGRAAGGVRPRSNR